MRRWSRLPVFLLTVLQSPALTVLRPSSLSFPTGDARRAAAATITLTPAAILIESGHRLEKIRLTESVPRRLASECECSLRERRASHTRKKASDCAKPTLPPEHGRAQLSSGH